MDRNKWNKTDRLKAIRKNYIDKDKEKKGIFYENDVIFNIVCRFYFFFGKSIFSQKTFFVVYSK